MSLKRSRVRRGEWIAALASVLLAIAMLSFTWGSETLVSGGRGPRYFVTISLNGWHTLTIVRWLMLVTIVCGLALTVAQAAMRAPAVPVTFSLLTMVLGGLTSIALFVRVLLDPPDGVRFGGVLGLLCACAIAYGGWLSLRDEDGTPDEGPAEIPVIDPHAAGRS
jgi:hypothetical protein